MAFSYTLGPGPSQLTPGEMSGLKQALVVTCNGEFVLSEQLLQVSQGYIGCQVPGQGTATLSTSSSIPSPLGGQ